jgi:ubiquinol-cytochrome c reductase cytochrome c1 subunit
MTKANAFVNGTGLAAGALLAVAMVFSNPASAFAETGAGQNPHEQQKPPRQDWSFAGPFGHYDQPQLQRGFQVYREVCANCHSLKLVAFRNLADPGGPSFSDKQVKALAVTYKIKDGPNDSDEKFERPGRPRGPHLALFLPICL